MRAVCAKAEQVCSHARVRQQAQDGVEGGTWEGRRSGTLRGWMGRRVSPNGSGGGGSGDRAGRWGRRGQELRRGLS